MCVFAREGGGSRERGEKKSTVILFTDDQNRAEHIFHLYIIQRHTEMLRNPGRDISFPIFIRKEIETRKLERKSRIRIWYIRVDRSLK